MDTVPLHLSEWPTRLTVRAGHLLGPLDPLEVRRAFAECPLLGSDPLLLEVGPGQALCLPRFGVPVFWNCDETTVLRLLTRLMDLPGGELRALEARDDLQVVLGTGDDRVSFSEVRLRALDPGNLALVSLALAQSVALEHFERSVSTALARYQPAVAQLREHGRVALPHREVLRTVGFALDVRGAVLESLTLFDDPPQTWDSEALARLDAGLYDQFDLEERLKAIHLKLAHLQDTGHVFLELLTHRKSHRLEWIVIALIAFEIGWTLVKELILAH